MNKQEKKSTLSYCKILLPILIIIIIGGVLLAQILLKQSNGGTSTETGSESLIPSDTEVTEIIEEVTETEEVYVSYPDKIALDYVETPVKRTREQAVEKIKELSLTYPELVTVYENEALYPLEIIYSIANNPEMTDYTLGYLTSDGTITGGFDDEELPEDYPLFLQYDPRWGYLPFGSNGTVGSSGCGPSSLSMAIFYLTGDRSATPGTLAEYALSNGYYIDGVGTAWSMLTAIPKNYGLSSYKFGANEDSLKAELDNGRIVICSVRPGDFTAGGHFIVIYGYDENGFKINDPKCVYRSRLSWTYDQIYDDIKASWSIGY